MKRLSQILFDLTVGPRIIWHVDGILRAIERNDTFTVMWRRDQLLAFQRRSSKAARNPWLQRGIARAQRWLDLMNGRGFTTVE